VEVSEESLERFFSVMSPLLDERQRRLLAGATARMLGRGGTTLVAKVSGMSRNTVIKAQAARFRDRLGYWEDRLRQLG